MSQSKDLEFESIRIGLASPEQIREWSYGEVTKSETINYRSLKPEKDGLFCERIFGPTKDWECHCGKYRKVRYKGKVCERCGVEVTRSRVRRERMGSIELATPVSHIWFFKGAPSRMCLLLDLPSKKLEQVLYYISYIVTDSGSTPIPEKTILTDEEYSDYRIKYENDFEAGMGAEAVKKLLQKIDLDQLSAELTAELETTTGQKRAKLLKRLDVVESFRHSGNRPEWMILDVIPVIPPDLRPMVQLDGGRFATSDLNDLYRHVINRNNRLKAFLEKPTSEIMLNNEKRMLQEAVDNLIENGRRGRPRTGANNRPLKSLSDLLKGKQGRFRQNLLGKRVDYSGRSVIVVGPELKMYQCGLPKEMALELFKPFVMKRLVQTEVALNIKTARKMIDRMNDRVWDALETVIKEHPVLLNRAPTLHRLGIQAFEPVLVEGRAIKLHPLVCTAYNADFDGDQMAVHVPLSAEAQAEARFLMLAANNLLKPSDGKPVAVPTQDMVLGSYYLTLVKPNEPGTGKIFANRDEAIMAYEEGIIGIHSPIKVRYSGKNLLGQDITRIIDATVGYILFNDSLPQDLGFVDRSISGHELDLEHSFTCNDDGTFTANKVTKKVLGKIIDRCIKVHGTTVSAQVLDKIKANGYHYSTIAAITVAVCDAVIPEEKKTIIDDAENQINSIVDYYNFGYISEAERQRLVAGVWNKATDDVSKSIESHFNEDNPIHMMAESGARGSIDQIKQLAGMRGLVSSTSGKVIETPIRSNYREGLNILEYFIASRGARKGLADTALRTADSGYLTRRLVDVSQDVIIREDDCHAEHGLVVYTLKNGDSTIVELGERLIGRYLLHDLTDSDGNVIATNDHMLTDADVKKILAAGIERVEIRSILNCEAKDGICKKCYGANLANGKEVTIGEAVGIIAAQSIGEPGTQLTMRTFHTGGIASAEDITQGLPRVEELFEARKPKRTGILAEISGNVRIENNKKVDTVYVTSDEGADECKYPIPFGTHLLVKEGDHVNKGDAITEGSLDPHDVLRVRGVEAVQDYIVSEVQGVYRSQSVEINDKHIEVIIRQMLRKYHVEDPGDTDLIAGNNVERATLFEENDIIKRRKAAGEDVKPAVTSPTLLGISKAALASDSFMSAASFQETSRVLTEAAVKGKTDRLLGLKENVIIGKLVPSGTGMKEYSEDSNSNAATLADFLSASNDNN